MKNIIGFFNIKEKDNGDITWNGFPVEKKGGNTIKFNEKKCDITQGIQKVITDTSNMSMKKIKDKDREIVNNILENLDFQKDKGVCGESKSGR